MSPRRNWDYPTPSPANECAALSEPKGGGAQSPVGEGVGEFQFRQLEKKLGTLSTLCSSVIGKKWKQINVLHNNWTIFKSINNFFLF